MKTELITKTLLTFTGTCILLISSNTLAFMPPQSAVEQCIAAVEPEYAILAPDLVQEAVRARPIGNQAAVIYLHTAV